jgi:hypothetical protein
MSFDLIVSSDAEEDIEQVSNFCCLPNEGTLNLGNGDLA